MAKVIVVGMDGLSWQVIDELAAHGRLANFSSLARAGRQAVLQSTVPPLTPAAWSTIFSGLPPQQHRMFDFTVRERGSYNFRLCTSQDRAAQMVWSRASAAGRKVVVLNVPMTAPPEQVNGLMVSGMDAGSLETAVSSREVLAKVLTVSPDYTIDVMSHWYENRNRFFRELYHMHGARHRLAVRILDDLEPDLFVCVYVLADRVQHAAWSWPPSPEVAEAYEALDTVVGDFLERLGAGDHLLLVSDHGFQELRAEVCLNRVLAEAGLLNVRRPLRRRRCRQHNRGVVHSRGSGGAPISEAWNLPPRAFWFDDVDWRRTRCAAFGLGGNLMLNLRGREHEGLVNEASEGSELLHRVATEIRSRLRPHLGETDVSVHPMQWNRESVGGVSPPDAVVEIDGYRVTTWGGREFFGPELVQSNVEGYHGTHSPEGVFMGVGPRLGTAPERGRLEQVDITPSILDLMRLDAGDPLPGCSVMES